MTNQGYIKLYRKIESNPFWLSEPFTKAQAWIDLILLANHKNNSFFIRGIKVDLKRGQVARAEEWLEKRWKWSRGKVRRFIKTLEIEQQIEQHTSNKINVLTIVNYNFYQKTEQQMEQQTEQQKENFYKTYRLYNNIDEEKEINPLLYKNMQKPFVNCIKALGGVERLISQIELYLICVKEGRSKKDFKNWINEPESYAENWEAILKEMKRQKESEENINKEHVIEDSKEEKIEYMPELQEQDFWKDFENKLKEEFKAEIYDRWLKDNLKPFYQDQQKIILSAPSKFLRDWIKREYLEGIKQILLKHNNELERILIIYSALKEQNCLTLSCKTSHLI